MKVLEDAVAAPELQSVKVNVVVVKGLNDSEVLDFVEMTKNKRMSVRFIEFMPFTGSYSTMFDDLLFLALILLRK